MSAHLRSNFARCSRTLMVALAFSAALHAQAPGFELRGECTGTCRLILCRTAAIRCVVHARKEPSLSATKSGSPSTLPQDCHSATMSSRSAEA